MSPEVSVVIPTIGRSFFKQAFVSALIQDFPDMEIVVVDFGRNLLAKRFIDRFGDGRVRYFKLKDPGRLEGYRLALSLAKGRYVKLLLDDDIILPGAIKRMVEVMDRERGVSLVTSSRLIINERGEIVGEMRKLANGDGVIDGIYAGDRMLVDFYNYIGEPSTVLFRLEDLDEPFGRFCGKDALCNDDIATWFRLLLKGDLYYVSAPLSCFRDHRSQTQKNKGFLAKGMIDFINHIMDGRKRGYLKNDRLFYQALFKAVYTVCNNEKCYLEYAEDKDRIKLIHLVKRCFRMLEEAGIDNNINTR